MDWKNKHYFSDNLDILRREVQDASVDLIYLNPPFNPSATYNVPFKEKSGEESAWWTFLLATVGILGERRKVTLPVAGKRSGRRAVLGDSPMPLAGDRWKEQ